MAHFKLLPKRKQFFHHKSNADTSKLILQHYKTLPKYASVTTNPNDFPIDNTPVNTEIESPVKVYSRTNYSFPPPSF